MTNSGFHVEEGRSLFCSQGEETWSEHGKVND